MKQTFKAKDGEKFSLEDVVGTTLDGLEDGNPAHWYVNLKDFRQLEVTDKTFHEVLDAKQEMSHAEQA